MQFLCHKYSKDGLHFVEAFQSLERLRSFFPALLLTKTHLSPCFGSSLKTISTQSPSARTFVIVGFTTEPNRKMNRSPSARYLADGLRSLHALQSHERLRCSFPTLILTKTHLPACFGSSPKTISTRSPSARTFVRVGSTQ